MRLLLLLFLAISLFARDNPFFPADPNIKENQTTNVVTALKPYSTQTISLPNSARAIKSIIIRYQNLDGSIQDEELSLNNKIDWHEPFIIEHKTSAKKVKSTKRKNKIIKTKYISYDIFGRTMNIKTKDKLLQNFLLTNPHRVVMDFKRETSFKPKVYEINKNPFTKIRMGNHDGYYRVVIELDGQYRYKLETRENDYSVICY